MAFNWTCPHCNKPQTVTESRFSFATASVGLPDLAEGSLAFERTAVGCSNPECRKLTLKIRIGADIAEMPGWNVNPKSILFSEQIIPRGQARPQPEYIPAPLREDYYEACLIRDLSPKASATLSRRCLQGMIRDFCKISKSRLIDEISALKLAVADGTADRAIAPETVEAIDHVRSLGNIGAHMEKDIDLIVSVDPGEAQVMIDLIELLFEEWYGARDVRTKRLAKIAEVRLAKDQLRLETKSPAVCDGVIAPLGPVPADSPK